MIVRDVFEDIVNATKLKTYNSAGTIINTEDVGFRFGYWTTVANELLSEGKSKSMQDYRYPLIFLHSDITEIIDGSQQDAIGTNPTFYILEQTRLSYNIEEQHDNIFRTILYPIYDEFIKQIRKCKQVKKTIDMYREKKDIFYMNDISPNQNKINDRICALEIKFSNLRIYTNPLA